MLQWYWNSKLYCTSGCCVVPKAHLLVTTLQSVAQEHATQVLNISPAAPNQLLGFG